MPAEWGGSLPPGDAALFKPSSAVQIRTLPLGEDRTPTGLVRDNPSVPRNHHCCLELSHGTARDLLSNEVGAPGEQSRRLPQVTPSSWPSTDPETVCTPQTDSVLHNDATRMTLPRVFHPPNQGHEVLAAHLCLLTTTSRSDTAPAAKPVPVAT